MNRGHLIAYSLGGSNLEPKNFVPLYRTPNYPVMYWRVEDIVRQRVEAYQEQVYYSVTPRYDGLDPIPYRLDFQIYTSGGYEKNCFIQNTDVGFSNC